MRLSLALAVAFLLAPGFAEAHPQGGHDLGFMAGLWHPLTGADHVVTAVLMGALAAVSRSGLRVPVVFLVAILVGFGLDTLSGGGTARAAEIGILVGLAAVPAAIAAGRKIALLVPWAAASAGLAHGAVHGAAAGGSVGFTAGVLSTTALLVMVSGASACFMYIRRSSPDHRLSAVRHHQR